MDASVSTSLENFGSVSVKLEENRNETLCCETHSSNITSPTDSTKIKSSDGSQTASQESANSTLVSLEKIITNTTDDPDHTSNLKSPTMTHHNVDQAGGGSNISDICQQISKTPVDQTISKRALKRQRKKEVWEQQKKERRALQREKKKKRKLDPSVLPRSVLRKQLKNTTMAKSNCHVSVVVDLSYDDYMDDKSLGKCVKQLCRCYGINRRAPNPVQYHITSNTGRSLKELAKNIGYENWDVFFHDEHFLNIFEKSKIIYLTSESENVIETIEDDKVYIIGGLVDHNKKKGLCHKLAVEYGLAHGRLPIAEHIDMKTRKVLTIDHVFNIIVDVANGKNWKDVFLEVIPERKGAKGKEDLCSESNNESE